MFSTFTNASKLSTMWSPISNTQLRVPPGFGNLLEAFAREVIRKQPANICAFGAAFFESMLAERQSVQYLLLFYSYTLLVFH